jgi:hypothetical protein
MREWKQKIPPSAEKPNPSPAPRLPTVEFMSVSPRGPPLHFLPEASVLSLVTSTGEVTPLPLYVKRMLPAS